MKRREVLLLFAWFLTALPTGVTGQSLISTISLRRDEIGFILTAPGIATRISFQEPVREIICGDLYDPESGRGTFVVQRSGNDVFLKPVGPKGSTNLFIKTGENPVYVYSFELRIVATDRAHRIVNVLNAQKNLLPVRGSRLAAPPTVKVVEISPPPLPADFSPVVPNELRIGERVWSPPTPTTDGLEPKPIKKSSTSSEPVTAAAPRNRNR